MNRSELAEQYFIDGYNCCQAVVLAYKDILNIDEKTIIKITSGFGGGIGQIREVCGAFVGVVIVVNVLYGPSDASNKMEKIVLYQRIQYLRDQFIKKHESVVCKELKGMCNLRDTARKVSSIIPCLELIKNAVEILDEYLKDNK